jgi:NADH-quinone oxidoreductase subunit B
MEVVRQQLGNGEAGEFRARGLNARQMLNGELEGSDLEAYVEERLMTTTLERAANWARGNAFMPASFGLACCAIEMMAVVNSRMDIARFGFEAFRASPRQADLMIISGRVSIKMAPVVRRVYDQMLEPKWAIAMGACSSSTGVFNNYAIMAADKFMPVDLHVPGCPPRPEGLVFGILKLRAMVMAKPDQGWRSRYGGRGTEEFVEPEPALGPSAAHADDVAGAMGRTGTSA